MLKMYRVDALKVKSGPTESGVEVPPVGGEMLPIDKLGVFSSSYGVLILILLILPIAFVLYKKRGLALKLFTPLISRFL
ncbi:hypothetical protein A3K80_05475 [Candidatus Bathyarchaeota archaeon RBG_13_38_9]|nr:MAG: hypothetical protein A3K80_05475 [Candidatus Bathyarchaeota archaeon RBG_13_38_9]